MDVVFAAIPAYGHIYPLMPLAGALRTAGHDVTLATGRPFLGVLDVDTVPAFPEHATLSWAEEETKRAHPDLRGREFGIAMFGDITANTTAAMLLDLWERRRPDLVVLESGNVGAAVAAHVDCRAAGYGPAMRNTAQSPAATSITSSSSGTAVSSSTATPWR